MVLEAERRQQLQTGESASGVAVRGPAVSGAQIILPLANGQTQEATGVLLGVVGVTVMHSFRRLAIPAAVHSGQGCRR